MCIKSVSINSMLTGPVLALFATVVASGSRRDHLVGPNPLHIDPDLDCGLRFAAYNYSMTLQPERAPQSELFDALRLGAECNFVPPKQAACVPKQAATTLPRTVGPFKDYAATYYVDAALGSDANSGTLAAPFQTIPHALQAARAGAGPANLVLRASAPFFLAAPLELTAADSYLGITAYAGDSVQPVVSGGVALGNLSWVSLGQHGPSMGPVVAQTNNVYDCGINNPGESSPQCWYNGTVPSAATCAANCLANISCTSYTWHDSTTQAYALCCYLRVDGVWTPDSQSGHFSGQKSSGLNLWAAQVPPSVLPFATLFLNNRRAIRARYPNGNPEDTSGVSPAGYTSAAGWTPSWPASAPQEIHVQSPSRSYDPFFPNYQWGIGGTVANFSPPESFWGTKSPPAGSQFRVPGGLTFSPASFSPNVGNWTNAEKGVVHAFHDGYWGDWAFDTLTVDAAASQILFGRGGWQEARGSESGGLFYIENIKEEIDQPNEWYFDELSNMLYFNFNNSVVDPNKSPVLLDFVGTQLTEILRVEGSRAAPVVGVTVQGVTFAHSAPAFMQPFEAGAGGDWSFYRGGAVVLEGTQACSLLNCTFWSSGDNSVIISGFNVNATVAHSHFAYAGASAVVSAGRGAGSMDAANLGDFPTGNLIAFNLIREIGIYVKQSGAYYHGMSTTATFLGNVVFNAPRAGININDGFGGGHSIANNLIANVVRETSDHGCFNSDGLTNVLKLGPAAVSSTI